MGVTHQFFHFCWKSELDHILFLNLLLFWNPNFGLESCFSILLAINFLTQICSWVVISLASQNVKYCRWFLLPRFVLWTFIIAHNPFYDPCLTLLRLEEKERDPFFIFFYSVAIFNQIRLDFWALIARSWKFLNWRIYIGNCFFLT